MTKEYKTIKRVPTPEEYKNLCTAVGWDTYMNFETVEEALRKSLFGIVIAYKDEIIGMGRIVGDGQIYFYIQDIAVVPEYQDKGIGSMIMEEIRTYLRENAPEKSFVGLFASAGKESFYSRYGFNNHEGMTGMFGVIHEKEIK